MKKLLITLLLCPFFCTAQKVSLGLGIGPAFFSQELATSVYPNIELTLRVNDKCEAVLSLANNRLQSVPQNVPLYGKMIAVFATSMKHTMIKVNRCFKEGLYIGFTSGLTFYGNPDSAVMERLYPNKYTITDGGRGYIAGVQMGFKYPASRRIDLAGEFAWLHNRIAAYKTVGTTQYPVNYYYSMCPVVVSAHYKFGINSNTKEKEKEKQEKKEEKEKRPKKRKSYEDEEWPERSR